MCSGRRWLLPGSWSLPLSPCTSDRSSGTALCKAAARISTAFVQEVRRHTPFFPIIGGRVKAPFEWRGINFAKGTWVLLDLYGTNRDGRCWEAPELFDPERFLQRESTAFDLVPQGGGEYLRGHRCPGEWITIELTKMAVRMLVTGLHYDVPAQDLSVHLPASRHCRRAAS